MKFLIFSIITLFLLNVGIVGLAQGQTLDYYPSLEEVSLQIQIRDSAGLLVAYYEPTQIYPGNIAILQEYLDTKENKSTILKDGKNLEIIKWEVSGNYISTKLHTSFHIIHKGEIGLSVFHDGFLSEPGDTVTASWKVIRPFN